MPPRGRPLFLNLSINCIIFSITRPQKIPKITFAYHNSEPRSSPLNLISWNCRGFFNKAPEISSLLNDYDIICLQETRLPDSKVMNLGNNALIRADAHNATVGPNSGTLGVGIIIKSHLGFSLFGYESFSCPSSFG